MKRALWILTLMSAVATGLVPAAVAQETPSTPGAKVSFANIKNGDSVTSPFKVEFALTGMTVARAGANDPGTGHHHLLIDTTLAPGDYGKPVPATAQHMHFGAAQTETTLTLPAGQHTLQLVLGDGSHFPHNPPVMSEVIAITVK